MAEKTRRHVLRLAPHQSSCNILWSDMFLRERSAAVRTRWRALFCTFCVCLSACTSAWGKLCGSSGFDNWLVQECQMAEEGIMADSSCCHEVEVGVWRAEVRGGLQGFFFVNGSLASLDPHPRFPIQACRGSFVERGWEPRNLAASGWPSSTSLELLLLSLLFSFLNLLFYILLLLLSLSVSPPPWLGLLCPISYFSVHLFYFKTPFSRSLSLSLLCSQVIGRRGILPLSIGGGETQRGGRTSETKRWIKRSWNLVME